jgi:hypothetical protein
MTSLTTLLFDTATAARSRLDAALGPGGLDLGQITVGGFAIQPPQVSGALLDLLDMPVGNLAVQGWEHSASVERAKQRTLADPGSREVVSLGEHTIRSSQSPTVDASLGGARVTLLQLDIEVTITVTGVRLVVEEGRIASATTGPARAGATVSAGGATLFSRETRPIDLDLHLPRPRADHLQSTR